jgi:hypothetical protein
LVIYRAGNDLNLRVPDYQSTQGPEEFAILVVGSVGRPSISAGRAKMRAAPARGQQASTYKKTRVSL